MTVRRPEASAESSPRPVLRDRAPRARVEGPGERAPGHGPEAEAEARRIVLERFAPVSLLVTGNGDTTHLSGAIERFLPCPEGTEPPDLLRRAHGVLADRVREVLAASGSREDARVVGSFGADVPAGVRSVRLTVIPVPEPDPERRPTRLVVLEEEPAGSPAAPVSGGPPVARVPSPASPAGGGELGASEELAALYAMLQAKAVDLRNAHIDLANLLGSIRDATLCLDRHLRLKWYNDAAAGLLGLEMGDRGRSIQDLARRLGDDRLCDDAQEVLRSLSPVERERPGGDGRRFVRRVRPYRTDPGRVDGVVITLAEARNVTGADAALRTRAEDLERSVATRMRDLDLLRRAVDAANHSGTLEETLIETCRLLCEHGGWSLGRALLAGAEDPEVLADSGAGWAARGLDCERLLAEWRGVGHGTGADPLAGLLHGGGAEWIAELAQAPPAPWIESARRAGFRCALLVPIRTGLRATGAFVLLAVRADEPDEATQQLLTLVGSTAGRVVERERFTRRLTELADEERRRIAQELHDGLGQELAGLGLLTASLLRDMRGSDLDSSGRIASIDHEVGALRARVRALTLGLLPAELRAAELPGALRELCERFSRLAGVDCRFEFTGWTPPVGDAAATHLHGIAQEAVRNAVQHGHAARVHVRLGGTDRIVLRVLDDGIGMDVTRRPPGGGLRIMRHRADLIGGTLTFESSGRGGVIVTCSVAPCTASPHEREGECDGRRA